MEMREKEMRDRLAGSRSTSLESPVYGARGPRGPYKGKKIPLVEPPKVYDPWMERENERHKTEEISSMAQIHKRIEEQNAPPRLDPLMGKKKYSPPVGEKCSGSDFKFNVLLSDFLKEREHKLLCKDCGRWIRVKLCDPLKYNREWSFKYPAERVPAMVAFHRVEVKPTMYTGRRGFTI